MEYKILIADDDVELVKILRTFFELRKYMVITAADGRETLKSGNGAGYYSIGY